MKRYKKIARAISIYGGGRIYNEGFKSGAEWAFRESSWKSVKDEMPEDLKHVLVCNIDGWIKVGYHDEDGWMWADGYPVGKNDMGDTVYSSYSSMEDVAYWAPIPQLQIGGII